MRPAIISLAAGRMQVALLETIRRSGRASIAVDRDPGAPGFRHASAHLVASTHDPAAILAGLASMANEGWRPVAVLTKSSGVPVISAARVAQGLGLRGLNLERLAALGTKDGLLDLAEAAGVPTPRRVVVSADELVPPSLAFPWVLKPCVTLVGKRGIQRVEHARDWPEAALAARAASGDGRIQAEEFLPGRDVIWAGLFRPGATWRLGFLEEDTRFGDDRRVRSAGFSMPARLDLEQAERLDALARRLLEGAELGFGSALIAFRVSDDGGHMSLLEAHFDLAGEGVTDRLIPAATGVDFQRCALDLLVGGELPAQSVACRPTSLRFVDQRASCAELASRLRLPGVLGLQLEAGKSAVRGLVLVQGSDRRELDRRLRRLDAALAADGVEHAA